MPACRPIAVAVISLFLCGGLDAQQADMAAITKWTAARVVHYHMVGVFHGDTLVADDEPAAHATVSDRLVLDFDWDIKAGKVAGQGTIENADSTLKDLRNVAPSCPVPVLNGLYEFFTGKALAGSGGPIQVTGTRTFPEAAVTAGCHGVWEKRTVPARQADVSLRFVVPAPMMIAMPAGTNPNVTVSDDKASFTMKDGDWTWTYTPTVVN